MENTPIDSTNQKSLVDELVEGRDLTKELYSILQRETSSSSSSSNNNEAPSLRVTQEILSKIERSLTILRYEPMIMHSSQGINNTGTIDSPLSFSGTTPKSPDSSEGDFKDSPIVDCKEDSRKRKVIPRYTVKVEGCCKSGLEGPVDDGFSWRKYGQKDILGTNFPRAYYRCTQRNQGCFATKQVQRSDDDPTYFEVTYRGKHTCYQASASTSTMPYPIPKSEPNTMPRAPPPQEILWNFEIDSNDIKPNVITSNNNINRIQSSSFSPHISSNHSGATPFTQNNTPNNNDFNDNNTNNNDNNDNLFSTRIKDENLNDYNDHNSSNPTNVTSDFSFDHEELDPNFIFDNLHLFQ